MRHNNDFQLFEGKNNIIGVAVLNYNTHEWVKHQVDLYPILN